MTIRIELDPETEARLIKEARTRGLPLEKMAERLLYEALGAHSPTRSNLTLDGFHAMLNALAQGSERLPNLPTESFTRESFYQDTE
jgi:hypothetical protein